MGYKLTLVAIGTDYMGSCKSNHHTITMTPRNINTGTRCIQKVFVVSLVFVVATVCETKCCGIIDQSLFYIDLTIHYIQHFENLA